MIITHEREKLVQAILFFARNTRKLGKTKLFKLLYFLDFEHFSKTGRSVTGLRYNAWPKGPVPVPLFKELDKPEPDLSAVVHFEHKDIQNGQMLTVTPKAEFSDRLFSKRELRILNELAKEYRNATADEMVEKTHLENLPWHQIYNKEGKKQEEIPYELAVRNDERNDIMRVAHDRKELLERLSNEPGVGIL